MTEVRKMTLPQNAPAAIESGKEKRTQEDQARAKAAIARAATSNEAENKDPNREAENPAPLEEGQPTAPRPKHHDLAGQQGGQKGGGREQI